MTPVKTLFYNKIMRTIQAIIFVICLTASSTLCGQVPDKFAQAAGELITGKTAARGAAAVPDEAARLQAQVQRSYKQALRVQQKYADVSVCAGPSKSFVSSQEQARDLTGLNPADIYPQVSSLTSQQIPSYFLTRHNLRLRQWLPVLDARQKELIAYEDELEKHRIEVTHPFDADMRWLADRVTDDTKYLLLGERHGYPEITKSVAAFMHFLRLKHPDREIILLTEFLPEGTRWQPNHEDPIDDYTLVWIMAKVGNIPVIGLEPQYVTDLRDVTLECTDCSEWPGQQSVWGSLEGVRLRNDRYLQSIHQIRQKHPNALFVIYGGAGHMRYTEPYSLGRHLAGEHTQVALIYPRMEAIRMFNLLTPRVDDFDVITGGQFPQRVLWWDNPAAAKIAGFDIRIKTSVTYDPSYVMIGQ